MHDRLATVIVSFLLSLAIAAVLMLAVWAVVLNVEAFSA